MDWLTFIVNLVGSLAWPVVVLVVILFLRRHVNDLVPFLQKLKYKELELEFGRRVEQVKEDVGKLPTKPDLPEVASEIEAAARIAEVNPRAAILETWREVEQAAREAARRLGAEDLKSDHQVIWFLGKHYAVNPEVLSLLYDLRNLRNQAAHSQNFTPEAATAVEYATSAAAVARYLRDLKAQ
jgi:hypothetical protein